MARSFSPNSIKPDIPNVEKQKKAFTVKLKVLDVLLVCLFTIDNSRGSKRDQNTNGFQKKTEDSDGNTEQRSDKKRAKKIVQKCVKMIKSRSVKISHMCDKKIKHPAKSGVTNGATNSGVSDSERCQKHLSFFDNLKMAYRNSGKGKISSPNMKPKFPNYISESTMLQRQSDIQAAIAH
ncbi:hypothetical protein KI387_037542, partial [Taxus chinensis]